MTQLEREQLIRVSAQAAKAASRVVAKAPAAQRQKALLAIADAIDAQAPQILAANAKDVATASGLSAAMVDRLTLDAKRVAGLSRAVREVAAQEEILGRIDKTDARPNGLEISRVRIPLGVIAMIYEARPNVTTDAAALCLKAGNACILRGGREALESNRALLRAVQTGLATAGLPAEAVQLIPVMEREAIADLVKLDELIDL
ncbi:MAG TPA: aldehyde dehydrogenase family protein, partial [Kofleriaceae bacterium]|nr:aldehyde dehydrogenase family protein [Kofleriaceae bacterium]